MRFEFATATRILFGPGAVREAPALAAALGRRALLVTGRNPQRAEPLRRALEEAGVACVSFACPGEPSVDDVVRAVRLAREAACELVVGFGGGSVVDCAKATAGLLTNPGEPTDYLEVVGRGQPLERPAAPWIAIPTTAGTGAEVTRNAVLACPSHRVKVSLRSPRLLARVAIVDPELTHALPAEVTARTGMDALTQLIEPFVSARRQPITDALCREALPRAARSLKRACERGDDAQAREDMALASLFSGLALANAGLGAVHGFAGPIGGMFPAPHGAVCAALLPHVMEVNLRALRRRTPDSPVLARYDELARLLTGNPTAQAADGVAWVRQLAADLGIPPLRTYGIGEADVPVLCAKARAASSMKGNPIPLEDAELRAILEAAL
ncbi:MAG: iron-containing alcohol dehydrogenase [Verrucomicrobia bacterium]|nr:MAG: iron-containing alcohol dehydrogenase [Verrucomicrobiota bacterium]